MQAQNAKQGGQRAALLSSGQKWTTSTLENFRDYCKLRKSHGMREVRTEDFVIHAKCLNLPMPATPNSWGALTNLAVSEGIIKPTNKRENASNANAKDREIKIWSIA